MDDMLSFPYSPSFSLETSSVNSSSTIRLSLQFFRLLVIQSTISAFFFTYQIPSHPIIIKSMF